MGRFSDPAAMLGRDLGTNSIRSVRRWFRELEHYGFIVKTAAACLGVDGDGIAAHWRLTECHSFDSKGTHIAATRDFDRWDGTPFGDPEKNRIPSPKGTHPESQRDSYWRSKAGPKRRPKRVPKGLIDSAPSIF